MSTAGEPIGLSTSWNGPGSGPQALLDQAQQLGFKRLEAYCHFTPRQLRGLAAAARERDMHVASLHAPCPVAVDAMGERVRMGDWLASTVDAERLRAVDAHRATIDAAAEIGARAIVIHLGTTGVASHQKLIFDTIARFGRGSVEHRQLVDDAWRERQARRGPHVLAALRSIRALGEHAVGSGVRLGVEIRDGYQEIPSLDEMAEVLAATAGLPVGYWHDAGHGAKLDFAGFIEHEEYLRRYSDRLVGMHVHDTQGGRDHLAPGQGGTDFGMLAQYLQPDSLKTLELHPIVSASQIASALDVLDTLNVFGVREGILVEL